MKTPENIRINYGFKSIAKNTVFNLLGYGLPLIFALIFIPFLIKGLGEEKFGILNLVWIVIGYFSFFDFGIGRAITQIVAEKIGQNQIREIPKIFWTSFFLMSVISVLGTVVLFLVSPLLVYDLLKISEQLQPEVLNTFYILAIAVPIVTTTAGLRGLLESYQKFGIINIIRIVLGVSSFLLPLLCLIFTESLIWIVVSLLLLRIVVWFLYLFQCLKLNIKSDEKKLLRLDLIKSIFKLSSWMTISNVTVPVIAYIDRFLIGIAVSAAAISYYAIPYEIVTKLLLIPGAMTGVLFPAFSANYLSNYDFTKKVFFKAVKYTFMLIFPVLAFLISFSYEGMDLWLGKKFAEESSLILQLLAVGVMFNSVAYIPFTFLQGIRKPDIPAKINLIELPFYLVLMWFAVKQNGIAGVAFIWMLRMIVDSIILFLITNKQISSHYRLNFKPGFMHIVLLIIVSVFPIMIADLITRILITAIQLLFFVLLSWKILLVEDEKIYLISRIRLFFPPKSV